MKHSAPILSPWMMAPLMASLAAGCTTYSTKVKDTVVKESFEIQSGKLGGLSAKDAALLVIKKTSLDREFLFNSFNIPQQGMPTSHGLQGRIVTFHKQGKQLFLMESTQGQVVTNELPASLILAELPIVEETADSIVMDFNAGIKQAFMASALRGSDFEGRAFKENRETRRIQTSYLQAINLYDEALEIRQIAQVDDNGTSPTEEFRYFFRPYVASLDFVARETSDFRRVGYFETTPIFETGSGREVTRIARHDHRKPIVYHISANTPAEYATAIKEGVLYWNKAFGREVVQVAMAPAGVTAPDPRYNVIQWVTNDSAGFAYANSVLDPRSGQVVNSQVFLTSIFATSVKRNAGSYGRNLEGSLCDLDFGPLFAQMTTELRSFEATPETIQRMTTDRLRLVTAHEVGHTLGLRHNFAGSVAATVTQEKRREYFKDYLAHGTTPSAREIFTSSVMDYTRLEDTLLASAQIATKNGILPYDELAIRWGYDGEVIDPTTAPPYCSDKGSAAFQDCRTFDAGSLPLVSARDEMNNGIRSTALMLVERYIGAKTAPDRRDRIALQSVPLDIESFSKPIITAFQEGMNWLKVDAPRSIVIDRQFPYMTLYTLEEAQQRQREWINAQLQSLGGVDKAFLAMIPADGRNHHSLAEEALKQLEQHLANPNVSAGIGYDGKPYTLSAQETQFIISQAQRLFPKVEEAVLKQSVEALGRMRFTTPELEQAISSIAKAILLQTVRKDARPTGPENLPVFRYPYELRMAATQLLASGMWPAPGWNLVPKREVIGRINQMLLDAFGDPAKVDVGKLTREQRAWLLELVGINERLQRN